MGTVSKPPPHPLRRMGIWALVVGGLASAMAIFRLVVDAYAGALPVLVFGAASMGWGVSILRAGGTVQLVNTALDRATRGQLDEATSILDTISTRNRPLLRAMAVQRAFIALYRDDAKNAVVHASQAIDGRYSWLDRMQEIANELTARGIRAVAAATCNDATQVREDVDVIQSASLVRTETRLHAVLAEAILLFRQGRFDEARAMLVANRRLLLDFGAPRQRAIVRAMLRSIAERTSSVYREAARREDARGNEPLLTSWIASVAPGAEAFASAVGPTVSAAGRVGLEALRTKEGAAHAAAAERAVRHRFAPRWKRGLLLWGLLVAMFMAIWVFFTPVLSSDVANTPTAIPEEPDNPLSGLALPVLLVGAFFVTVFVYQRRLTSNLLRAERLWVDGDDASAEAAFRRLTKNVFPLVAAQARFYLAQMALLRADFDGVIGECDMGLGKVVNNAMGRQLLVPHLLAARAEALAALGRSDEATAAVGSISKVNGAYPFIGATQLRVRLLQAIRRGDLSSARELARQRTPDLPLPLPVETLADALSATDEGHPEGCKEAPRILSDLATDASLRNWFDAVWPRGEALLGQAARRAEQRS